LEQGIEIVEVKGVPVLEIRGTKVLWQRDGLPDKNEPPQQQTIDL
jgi:hypothetical protein